MTVIDELPAMPTEFTELFLPGTIAVIRAAEELSPCYLMEIVEPPHDTETPIKDSYGNSFSAGLSVASGHYLELIPRSSDTYYVDDSRTATVYSRCLLPIVLGDLQSTGVRKIRGKDRLTRKISPQDHEDILAFLNSSLHDL